VSGRPLALGLDLVQARRLDEEAGQPFADGLSLDEGIAAEIEKRQQQAGIRLGLPPALGARVVSLRDEAQGLAPFDLSPLVAAGRGRHREEADDVEPAGRTCAGEHAGS
jgi:hypothetical protein